MMYIATPVALVAFYVPAVTRFIERHFAAELLAIIFLGLLGFYLSLPRLFSRRPGAMVYLRSGPIRLSRNEFFGAHPVIHRSPDGFLVRTTGGRTKCGLLPTAVRVTDCQ